MTITETIARAMHTALMNVRGVTIEDIRNRVPAAITALTEAGYAIVPVEPTEAMVLEGSYILAPDDTSAPRIWQAMITAAAPIDSEKGE